MLTKGASSIARLLQQSLYSSHTRIQQALREFRRKVGTVGPRNRADLWIDSYGRKDGRVAKRFKHRAETRPARRAQLSKSPCQRQRWLCGISETDSVASSMSDGVHSMLVDLPAPHDESHMAKYRDIRERIAGDGDNVRVIAGGNRADAFLETQ
jgi:hypothetical protein